MPLPEAPLLFDDADRDLYVARPEVEFWLRSAVGSRGGGWLLLGTPGAGKTTLLRWLEHELDKERAPVAWVDAGAAVDAAALIDLIFQAIGGRATVVNQPEPARTPQERLLQLRAFPRSCVLVDNLASTTAAFDLFGRMRDLVWASGHAFVVTGRQEDVAVLRRPPADAFFSHAYTLPPPQGELLKALALRAGASREHSQQLMAVRPASLRAAVRYLNAPAASQAEASWRGQLNGLSPTASNVAEQVLELDRPVGATDAELQARTGLGEIALRRYLRRLNSDGVLRRVVERTAQPGRPRLTYEPDIAPREDM